MPSGRIERMLLRSVRPLVMRLLTKTIRLPFGVKVGSESLPVSSVIARRPLPSRETLKIWVIRP